MNAALILIISEAALLALVVVILFARLSYHYGKMYQASPAASSEFQREFARSGGAGQDDRRGEVGYRPFEQLQFLAYLRARYGNDPKALKAIDAVMSDIRLTLGWLAVSGILAVSTIIALF